MPQPVEPAINVVRQHGRFPAVQFEVMAALLGALVHGRIDELARDLVPLLALRCFIGHKLDGNRAPRPDQQDRGADQEKALFFLSLPPGHDERRPFGPGYFVMQGSVTVNVLPMPSSLVTQMMPP